jgi:hypothetical protein
MDRLLELLARIAALVAEAADSERPLAEVPQEELESLLSDLQEAYAEAREGSLTTSVIDALEQGASAIQTVVAEDNTRVEEHEALEARAAELDALAIPVVEAEADEAEAADGETDPIDAAEAVIDVASEEAPEPEAAPQADERVLVPATAAPAPAPAARVRVPLARMRERQPASARPTPPEIQRRRVIAAAGLPNVAPGGEFSSRRELSETFIRTWDANVGAAGDGVQVAVARIETPYPDDHRIGPDASPFMTTSIMERAVTDFTDSIVAAGGICAPTEPYYPQAMISTSARPVFDGLPRIQATRGGINWVSPPTLSSILTSPSGQTAGTAISQVTAAQDLANATKPHQLVTCGATQNAQIYAVTNILEFGNMQGRTYPELVDAWSGLAEAAWARFAENLLLSGIVSGSTAVTSVQVLGVARDILNQATVAAEAYRNRHRMDPMATIVCMFPRWLIGAIQSDIWSAFNTGDDEANTVSQASIESWFRVRNIRVIWFQDGVGPGNPAAQIFPAQAAGALLSWPKVCQWYMFHEGAWLILDGGTLDLGIVRDSTLNAANKYQMFFESFENIAFVGIESLRIRSTICVNGATAGTIDPSTICDGGS